MKDIPGFNADVSLHKTRDLYDFRAVWVDGVDRQEVVQQIEFNAIEVVPLERPWERHCETVVVYLSPEGRLKVCQTYCYEYGLLTYISPFHACKGY